MLAPKFIKLVAKYIIRHRMRSLLTISGVATAMFLFYAVEAMQNGVREATQVKPEDNTLVVYREDRFCPFTSRLPQDYSRKILAIPGVRAVLPLKVVVNNCRASLDVVTFRGVPKDSFELKMFPHIKIIAGSIEDWKKRSDAALLGHRLAKRRNLKIGDRLVIGGIAITVAGIIDSNQPQDQNVAYSHLDFIQQASDRRLGVVTQFNVIVESPSLLEKVADAIDAEFKNAQEPTSTWSEKAFVARATTDIIEIISFTKWLGWGALIAVFALVANAIILSVQDRIKDHAIFQTLGFTHALISRLIVLESLLLSLIGGVLGLSLATGILQWSQLSFSVEGLSLNLKAAPSTIGIGLGLCAAIGILAGLFPAWQASKRETAACFRAI